MFTIALSTCFPYFARTTNLFIQINGLRPPISITTQKNTNYTCEKILKNI